MFELKAESFIVDTTESATELVILIKRAMNLHESVIVHGTDSVMDLVTFIDQARDIAVYLFEPFMYCPACSFNAKVCDLLMLLNLFHNNVFLQSHFSIEASFMATEDKSPSSVVKC